MPSSRAAALVEQLHAASQALIALIQGIDAAHWVQVPREGVWSAGKDAEHVVEGNAVHQWAVRQSVGQQAGARPAVERARLTALGSQADVVDRLRRSTDESVQLIHSLTDEQLDLPMRTRTRTVAQMIERVLIGHYDTHRGEIQAKLRRAARE